MNAWNVAKSRHNTTNHSSFVVTNLNPKPFMQYVHVFFYSDVGIT
jgi:hypothetical protein